MKLVTVAEMMRLEAESAVPVPQLMEKAGLAVAQEAWLALGEIADRRLLVLCGPGNNGGDGLVAACHLKEWAADVIVFLLKPRPADDAHHSALVESEIPIITAGEDGWEESLADALGGAELVIDALLGTGRARAIEGDLAAVLAQLKEARERRLPPRLLAVDLPSGLDADTGAVDPLTVAADPALPEAAVMGGVGALALAANAGSAALLYWHRGDDLNMRSVWLCSRNDAIANIAVILAAGAVAVSATAWPDLAAGALIAGLELSAAYSITHQALVELRQAKVRLPA